MIKRVAVPMALAAAILAVACATAPKAPATVSEGVFAGANGMTLYTFDRDTADSGKSVCNGPCATLWPPLLADESAQPAGGWTVITRDDGKRQWAYKGKPIYYFARDQKAGDRSGDNFNNVWRLARP